MEQLRRLIFIEDTPVGLLREAGDRVVSLTAQASYQLDRLGLSYTIPADVGLEAALARQEPVYWQEQLAWLDMLDALLLERLEPLRRRLLRPSLLYGYALKVLLDDFIIRCMECASVLDAAPARRVVLCTRTPSAPSEQPVSLRTRVTYAQVLQQVCAARGIAYEEQLPENNLPQRPDVPEHLSHGAAAALRRALLPGRELLWTLQAALGSFATPSKRMTLLLLETNEELRELLRRGLQAGHRCLVRRGDHVIDPGRPGWRRLLIAPDPPQAFSPRWSAAAEACFAGDSQIWNWLDRRAGCAAAPVLGPQLRAWVAEELPATVSLADRFHAVYTDEQVDAVVLSSVAAPTDLAALAAAKQPGKTQSVLVAHGSGPDLAAAWDLFDLFSPHHYVVPDEEIAGHFQQRRAGYDRPTAQIHVGSYRWERLVRHRRPWRFPGSRPLLVYVVGRPEGHLRYLNKPECSDPWYYRLQTAVIRLLAATPEYRVVVKLFPASDRRISTVEQIVHDAGAAHLSVSRAPFPQWLRRADRVLMDWPSTPLYETALAGVPFHALIHRGFAIRPSALEVFKPFLTVFEEPAEAVEAVRRYLRAPAVRWSLPRTGGGPLETLSALDRSRGVGDAAPARELSEPTMALTR